MCDIAGIFNLDGHTISSVAHRRLAIRDLRPAGHQPCNNFVVTINGESYNFCEPEDMRNEDEYAEELDSFFRLAFKRQLVSDADLGTYHSGGMDFGSITALLYGCTS